MKAVRILLVVATSGVLALGPGVPALATAAGAGQNIDDAVAVVENVVPDISPDEQVVA